MYATQPTLPASSPKGPIIVLGKKNNFLYPLPTVASAVDSVNRYLSSEAGDAANPSILQTDRLRLDELDFFDGTARRLEPVVDENSTLIDLIVEPDLQAEIRARINQVFVAAEERLQQLQAASVLAEELPALPSDDLTFDELLETIENEPKLRPDAAGCNYLAWVFGQCHTG